ncbi:glycosyltransferase family 2 protein [Isoptericola sp. NEAU-Y5]|uniref:Glycosyltransferase family 2 protein n=1 Tax=Isoptericola luteus TaxID=2879484 RepID=A0ABS7ZH05_9MICO|nr:glycosyltransferase family 2 protein [Isoptericola sp. NEAU-Y5]MCA5892884.1 glycosyltransferase family 2 protein [Isoptericola sp. NEAU-Y5]
MPEHPRSLVVVLNYRGRADTLECVASLVEGSPAHTVLVVDNGSHDGVLDAVRDRWPATVATLQNGTNLGFAGGMNSGLRWAREHGYDVVTVLNNDTVVRPGTLDLLVARALAGQVAVSPAVRYRDGVRVWFAGGGLDPEDGLPHHLSDDAVARLHGTDPDGPYATDLLAGCCVTASAATWATVGDFDERFFLNFEDSEWSVRARRLGTRLEVEPRATVLHSVSASFVGAYSYLGAFYYARNSLLYTRLVGGGRTRTLRLLRRRVLPSPVRIARAEGWREGARKGAMVVAGIAAHSTRRYGRAPRWVEARAGRWTRG